MKPGRKLYSRILACALTAGFIDSSAAVNVSAAEVKPTDIRATIIPSFSPTIAPLPSYYIPVPTVEPTVTILPTIFPTAFIPGPTVTPVIPTLEPTSGIPTVAPSATALPTNVTTVPTSSPTAAQTASPKPAEPTVRDISGDGKVSAVDVRLILRHIIGDLKLEGDKLAAADANEDGNIDSVDAVFYLRQVVNEIMGAQEA